ncbi:Uncharacterised protein [Mycobacterium tuberculosis]|nr:Uncharacterised protein [Mycobacterium tuberculosis]
MYARDSAVPSWSSTTSRSVRTSGSAVMRAAPPHRCALHRRRRGPLAPLLLIAALCIVAGAGHGVGASSRTGAAVNL